MTGKTRRAWWPLSLFALYYVFMYCIPFLTGFDNARYVRFAMLAMVLVGELFYFKNKLIIVDKNLIKYFCVFLIVTFVGLTRNFTITNMEVFTGYFCCLLMLLIRHRNIDVELRKVTNILLVFSAFVAITVIIQWINPSIIQTAFLSKYDSVAQSYANNFISRGSYTGIFTEVSITCAYLVLGLGISVYSRYLNRHKFVKYFLIAFFGFTLLLTAKRAQTLLALFSIPLVYMLKSTGRAFLKKILKVIFAMVLGIVILIIVISQSNSDLFERYAETIVGLVSGSDITSGRTLIWAQAFQLILTWPIFGSGWGKSEMFITRALGSSVSLGAHNLWIQLWADFGIIGVAIFAILFIYIIANAVKLLRVCYHQKDIKYSWAISLCAYYVLFFAMYSVFASPLFDRAYSTPFFIFVVFLFVIKKSVQEQQIHKA